MRWLIFSAAAILSFVAFLVMFAPASVAWGLVRDDVNRAVSDLELLAIDGTVWSGDAIVRYREFPPATLTWSLQPTSVLSLQPYIDLQLAGDGLAANGSGHASRTTANVDLHGGIDASYVNAVSTRYGLTFPGRLAVENLLLTSDHRWLTEASGQINWSGGTVQIDVFQDVQLFTLPPLRGNLSLQGNVLRLDVTDDSGGVMVIDVKPDGWAVVDIKVRMLAVAGLPYARTASLDDTALVLEEKIF